MYYFNQEDAKIWQALWNSKIHYRLKVTLWRFVRGVIPTRDRLQVFANLVDISYPLYVAELEDDLHM